MGDVTPLPRRQLVLTDERGVALRATWHAERELVVLSVWHGDRCTCSFRLRIIDVPQLAGLLASVTRDWAEAVVATRRRSFTEARAAGDHPGTRLAALARRIRWPRPGR